MAAFSPIVSTFARMSTQAKPVSACVKVRVHTITATEEAMPGGQAYMVWLNRNGKARGTQLVWATPGKATFDESVSVRCTLYRTKNDGFLSKEFELQVLHNETNYEAPGQTFGKAILDLSCDLGRQQITLIDCIDPDATIDISVDVEILETPASPTPALSPTKTPKKQSQVSKLIKRSSQKLKRAKKASSSSNKDNEEAKGGEAGERGREDEDGEEKSVEASDEGEGEGAEEGNGSDGRFANSRRADGARDAGPPTPSRRPSGSIMITPKNKAATVDHTDPIENNEDEIVGGVVPSRADRFLETSPKKVPLQESEKLVNQSNVAEAKDSPGMSDATPTKPTAAAPIERPPMPIRDAWA
mmetsp:Transcript_17387/g.45096  ORF Transcript_17387/g.45096 Transcript_17387/m.45096 type:complete len:358 (+) Transcript_17387:183-1256(+)